MVSSFAELRGKTKEINNKVRSGEFDGGNRQDDPRLWYPKRDGEGLAEAVIRFLPPSKGADVPYVSWFKHKFKGPRSFFYAVCPTSFDDTYECPVCEANTELWQTETEANQNIARNRKRKVEYFANIYIVKDPASPENEGQVRVLRFGPMIYKILMKAAKPKFANQEPIEVFDPWEDGANFFFRITKDEDGDNITYVDSEFDRKSRLAPTDEEIEAIWEKQHDLTEFIPRDQLMSQEDMKAKFDRALGKNTDMSHSGPRLQKSDSPVEEQSSRSEPAKQAASEKVADVTNEKEESSSESSSANDQIMNYLNDM